MHNHIPHQIKCDYARCHITYVCLHCLQMPDLERDVVDHLLPKDAADTRSVILEVRAGTGGDEAALFTADLLRMYELYSAAQGWRFEVSP